MARNLVCLGIFLFLGPMVCVAGEYNCLSWNAPPNKSKEHKSFKSKDIAGKFILSDGYFVNAFISGSVSHQK